MFIVESFSDYMYIAVTHVLFVINKKVPFRVRQYSQPYEKRYKIFRNSDIHILHFNFTYSFSTFYYTYMFK